VKSTALVLSVAVLLLIAACARLWLQCEGHERFTHIGTTNIATFVMFDHKTAQACWAGPPGPFTIASPDGKQQETNGANIPFCKDLK
jgi:hypothetical protein